MTFFAAAVILVMSCVLALVVAAPLIYMLRRRRGARNNVALRPAVQNLTLLQALPGLLVVIAFFFALASAYFAPESWLGQRVATKEGQFWFSVLVWLALFAMARAIRSFRKSSHTDRASD